MKDRLRFRIIPIEDGMALRSLVARRLPDTSPRRAADLIKAGGVYVNKLRIRVPAVRVAKGERITIYPGADEVARLDPSALKIAHRGASYIVIDKPSGVPAEPTRETCLGTISDALVQLMMSEGIARPYVGVVHRLEPSASGLIMFTTRGHTQTNTLRKLADHPIRRTYRLRSETGPQADTTVEQALVMTREGRLRLPREGHSGAPARTDFRYLGRASSDQDPSQDPGHDPSSALLYEVNLSTGTAEQILLHAHAGGLEIPAEHALCCTRLEFEDPESGAALDLAASLPSWAAP